MTTDFWADLGLAALWVATVFQGLFVVLYSTRPWRRHFVGRALFLMSWALAVMFIVTLVNHYLAYRYQVQVTVILFCFLAAAIVGQFSAMVRQWRIDRRRVTP